MPRTIRLKPLARSLQLKSLRRPRKLAKLRNKAKRKPPLPRTPRKQIKLVMMMTIAAPS